MAKWLSGQSIVWRHSSFQRLIGQNDLLRVLLETLRFFGSRRSRLPGPCEVCLRHRYWDQITTQKHRPSINRDPTWSVRLTPGLLIMWLIQFLSIIRAACCWCCHLGYLFISPKYTVFYLQTSLQLFTQQCKLYTCSQSRRGTMEATHHTGQFKF